MGNTHKNKSYLPGDNLSQNYAPGHNVCCGDIVLYQFGLYIVKKSTKVEHVILYPLGEQFLINSLLSDDIVTREVIPHERCINHIDTYWSFDEQDNPNDTWEDYKIWLKEKYNKYLPRFNYLKEHPKEILNIIKNNRGLRDWYIRLKSLENFKNDDLENLFKFPLDRVTNAAIAQYLKSDETMNQLINIEVGKIFNERFIRKSMKKSYSFEATNLEEAREKAIPFMEMFHSSCIARSMIPISCNIISKGGNNYDLKMNAIGLE